MDPFDATNMDTSNMELFDILNNIHDNIKCTMEQHNLYVPLLDIMTNKDAETKSMVIFHKKTDN